MYSPTNPVSVINRKFLVTGFFVSLFIIAVVSVLAFLNINSLNRSISGVKSTYSIISGIENLSYLIQSAETNSRGYILTGKQENLNLYFSARDKIFIRFNTIREHYNSLPLYNEYIDSLSRLISERIEILDSSIAVFNGQGLDASKNFIAGNRGAFLMNNIRSVTDLIIHDEQNNLLIRQDFLSQKTLYNSYTFIAGLFISFIALLLVFMLLNMEIKNRMLTEKQLTESRNWFSTTLAGIADGVIVTDEKGKIVFMNSAAEKITGWSFQEADRNDIEEIFSVINEHSRKRTPSPVLKALDEKKPVELENHTLLVTKNGCELPVDDSAAPLIIKGKLTGAVLIFRDIARKRSLEREREQLLEKLTHTSEALLDLYNNAPCGYHSLDKDGFITDINDTEAIWLGYTKDELIGKIPFTKLLTDDSRENFNINFPRFLKTGFIKDAEFDLIRKNGSILPVIVDATALKDSNGSFVKSRSTVYDNTIRKQSEKKIRELNLFLDNVIQNANNFICVTNSLNNVLIWNQAASDLTGYTFGEVHGKNLWKLLFADPFYYNAKTAELDELFSTQSEISNLEAEVTGTYGTKKIMLFNLCRLDNDPDDIRYIVVGSDITSRIENENKIKNLNKELEFRIVELKSINKEMESFVYSVSHDLRAPVRHIAGFVELLQKNLGHSLDEKNARYFNYVADSAADMGKLIDDLLNFSRLGRSGITLNKFKMNDLVNEVLKSMLRQSPHPVVTWEIGELPEVVADYSLMKIVMTNLFSNAVKYSSKNPQARVIVYNSGETDTHYTFSVKDNGVGFDMRYSGKLFGVFQRLHINEDFEGTGIGLAIVKKIIERHGGNVFAEGTPGKGATFSFTLQKPV